jgi:hypothetical protein
MTSPPQPPSEPEAIAKHERVKLILSRINDAPPAQNREEALDLIDRIFREVEDRHSGVPHDPFHPGRLYPPAAQMERQVDGIPSLRRYRHTGHYTLIAENGAIVIRVFVRGFKDGIAAIIGERTELDKPGADGRCVPDFE